jgi:hypothetical protein
VVGQSIYGLKRIRIMVHSFLDFEFGDYDEDGYEGDFYDYGELNKLTHLLVLTLLWCIYIYIL